MTGGIQSNEKIRKGKVRKSNEAVADALERAPQGHRGQREKNPRSLGASASPLIRDVV
jgi:hypothetical protein